MISLKLDDSLLHERLTSAPFIFRSMSLIFYLDSLMVLAANRGITAIGELASSGQLGLGHGVLFFASYLLLAGYAAPSLYLIYRTILLGFIRADDEISLLEQLFLKLGKLGDFLARDRSAFALDAFRGRLEAINRHFAQGEAAFTLFMVGAMQIAMLISGRDVLAAYLVTQSFQLAWQLGVVTVLAECGLFLQATVGAFYGPLEYARRPNRFLESLITEGEKLAETEQKRIAQITALAPKAGDTPSPDLGPRSDQ